MSCRSSQLDVSCYVSWGITSQLDSSVIQTMTNLDEAYEPRVRIPKAMYPRRIEAKLTNKQVGGEWIIEREMTMISKDGEISKFHEYHSSKEEEPTEQPRSLNKYEASDKEVNSDLESTARNKPKCKKLKKTAKAIPDRTFCNCPYCSK
ncbi:hypothetical protein Tco_0384835 [Tanacetum coccineum]